MSNTCIICLEVKTASSLKKLDQKNNFSKFESIYEMFVFCVPQIEPLLEKTHYVCFPCLYQLCECIAFIQKCTQSVATLIDVEKIKVEEICITNEPLISDNAIGIEESALDSLPPKTEENESEEVSNTTDLNNLSEEDDYFGSDLEDGSGLDLSDFLESSLPETGKNKCKKKKHHKTETVVHTCESDCEDGTCAVCNEDICKLITHTCKLNCTKCSTTFGSQETLEAHTKDCSGVKLPKAKKPYKPKKKKPKNIIHNCEIDCTSETCSMCNTYKCQLVTVHTCKFVCSKCSSVFDSKDKLETHNKYSMDEDECLIVCEYCPLMLPVSEIEAHQKIHPTVACQICGKLFFQRDSLRAHMVVHSERDKKCPVCPATFKTSTQMIKHHRTRHTGEHEVKIYLCEQCPTKFAHPSRLEKHKRQIHDHVIQSLCAICGMSFTSNSYAQKHARLIHHNEKPYCCELCGKSFGRKDYIERHVKTCNGSVKARRAIRTKTSKSKQSRYKCYANFNAYKPVECVYCKKIFKSLYNLTRHIESNHIQLQLPRPYKCEVCPLRFRLKAVLQRHEEKHKNTDTKFRCDICYKKFKNVEEVDEHISEKHKKTSHACNLCDEKFARKFLLDNHREAVHSEDRIFDTSVDKLIEAAIKHLEKVGNVKIVEDVVEETVDMDKDS